MVLIPTASCPVLYWQQAQSIYISSRSRKHAYNIDESYGEMRQMPPPHEVFSGSLRFKSVLAVLHVFGVLQDISDKIRLGC